MPSRPPLVDTDIYPSTDYTFDSVSNDGHNDVVIRYPHTFEGGVFSGYIYSAYSFRSVDFDHWIVYGGGYLPVFRTKNKQYNVKIAVYSREV